MTQFLAFHLVPGVEAAGPGWYTRSLRLPHGYGVVRLDLSRGRRDRPGPRPPDRVRRPRRRLGRRAVPPPARRRLRPRRRRPPRSATTRCWAARCAATRPARPRSRRRRRDRAAAPCWASRCRSRRPTGSAACSSRSPGTTCPRRCTATVSSRVFPTPAQVAALPDDAMPMPRSRQASLGVLAAAAGLGEVALDRSAGRPRDPCPAAGPQGHRALDGRLRADARAGRPRRLPARRRGRARGAGRPRRERSGGPGGLRRPGQPLALLRRHAPVGRAPRRARRTHLDLHPHDERTPDDRPRQDLLDRGRQPRRAPAARGPRRCR